MVAMGRIPLAGWRISGIGIVESGDALTISNVLGSANDFTGTDELFVQGNPNLGHSEKTFFNEFNTQKFSLPPNGVRGNSGLVLFAVPDRTTSISRSQKRSRFTRLSMRSSARTHLTSSITRNGMAPRRRIRTPRLATTEMFRSDRPPARARPEFSRLGSNWPFR
jgi:hypothetical protein